MSAKSAKPPSASLSARASAKLSARASARASAKSERREATTRLLGEEDMPEFERRRRQNEEESGANVCAQFMCSHMGIFIIVVLYTLLGEHWAEGVSTELGG